MSCWRRRRHRRRSSRRISYHRVTDYLWSTPRQGSSGSAPLSHKEPVTTVPLCLPHPSGFDSPRPRKSSIWLLTTSDRYRRRLSWVRSLATEPRRISSRRLAFLGSSHVPRRQTSVE